MKLTLICHFFNEEFFLPYFITHYQHQVDHAVMINYGSTDKSVEIIKSLAPSWEIRDTVNKYFDEPDITHEVMRIEQEFEGWKMCMNVTEFILHPDIKSYLKVVEREAPDICGVRVTAAYMVDHLKDQKTEVTDDPLVIQRTHGYFEDEKFLRKWRPDSDCTTQKPPRKARLIHKYPDGKYTPGRHSTNHKCVIKDPELVMCWFNWSPMRHVASRRAAMAENFSPEVKEHAKGRWFFENDDQFYQQYLLHNKIAENLLEKEVFKRSYDYFVLHFPKLRSRYLQQNTT